jgi:hypothetical protein
VVASWAPFLASLEECTANSRSKRPCFSTGVGVGVSSSPDACPSPLQLPRTDGSIAQGEDSRCWVKELEQKEKKVLTERGLLPPLCLSLSPGISLSPLPLPSPHPPPRAGSTRLGKWYHSSVPPACQPVALLAAAEAIKSTALQQWVTSPRGRRNWILPDASESYGSHPSLRTEAPAEGA